MTVPPPPPPQPPPPPPQQAFGPVAVPPQEIATLRVFVLVALIINSIATLAWLATTVTGGLATCGVGCLLIVVPAVTGIAIWLDALALSKLNLPPNPYVAGAVKNAAIMDIVAGVVGMSVVPLVMGILALVYLDKPQVRAYFGQNG
jgi:hypothetical protein